MKHPTHHGAENGGQKSQKQPNSVANIATLGLTAWDNKQPEYKFVHPIEEARLQLVVAAYPGNS